MLKRLIFNLFLVFVSSQGCFAGDELSSKKSILSESCIKGMYEVFKTEWKDTLSPVQGLLALRSDLITNARLKGNYGPLKEEFLCHYQITNSRIDPFNKTDCPQDCTSSILQQFFPSPAGGKLTLPGSRDDFFKAMPLDELADLLVSYVRTKRNNNLSNEEHFDFFKKWFTERLIYSGHTNPPYKKWGIKRNGLERLWDKEKTDCVAFHKRLITAYAKIFSGAITEQKFYPLNLVENAILGFVWKRAQEPKDFIPFFQKMKRLGCLDKDWEFGKVFKREDYIPEKIDYLDHGYISVKQFEILMKDPEKFVFNILAYDSYGSISPKLLGTKTSFRHLEKGGKLYFSDCGDVFVFMILNALLGNEETKSFDLDFLQSVFPNVDKNLVKLYEELQPDFASVEDDINLRAAFSKVLSGVNKGSDKRKVQFIEEHVNYQLASGFDNVLLAISRLLGDEKICPLPQDLESNDAARARGFTYLLDKFKRYKKLIGKKRYIKPTNQDDWTWSSEGFTGAIPQYGEINLCVLGEPRFLLKFTEHHFEILKEEWHGGDDWRFNGNKLQQLLSSGLSSELKEALVPYFVDGVGYKNGDYLKNADLLKPYLLNIIWGSHLMRAETVLGALDFGLTFSPEAMIRYVPRWINQLADDPETNIKIVPLLFKHKDLFEKIGMVEKLNRKETLLKLEKEIKNKPIDKVMFDLIKTPYLSGVCIYLLEHQKPTDIGDLLNNKKETLLHVACRAENIPVVKKLIEIAGEELLSIDRIIDENNETPLQNCWNSPELTEMILNHPSALPELYLTRIKTNIHTNFCPNENAIEMTVRLKQAKTLRVYLQNKTVRQNLLSGDNFKNSYYKGESLFCKAAICGDRQVANLFLNDSELMEKALSPEFIKDISDQTVLHLLAASHDDCSFEVLQKLMGNERYKKILLAPENLYTHTGFTPLGYAELFKNERVFDLFSKNDLTLTRKPNFS